MGEAKQEEAKAESKLEEKKVEKQEEKREEKVEEKKEEKKPSPPQTTVLFVDLHCVGCANKIERSILKCKGVEEVVVDMVENQVTVRGIVDPQALCSTIQKKTMRNARVLSPLPPAEGDTTTPEAVAPQVVGVATVELHMNMHCEACAEQLRRKILKMRGVHSVEIEQTAKRVVVTGTVTPNRLVEYIHRRTGKLAKVIPPPPLPPPPKEEEKKKEAEKKHEEKYPEENIKDKKEEEEAAPKEIKDNANGGGKDEKRGGQERKVEVIDISEEDMMAKKLAYLYGDGMINYGPSIMNQEEMARRRMQWMPIYVVEPPRLSPPPQLFSDENPNACSIS